jgi:hypothetical protein
MLLALHTDHAPWTVIRSDNKKKARINAIKHILRELEYPGKIKKTNFEIEPEILINGDQEIKNMETGMSLKQHNENG